MQPLRYSINVTLDGCCDHQALEANEDMHQHARRMLEQADALLFGRVIYEMMESAWRGPSPAGMPEWTIPFRRTIDAAKKYVVSSKLDKVDWNAELIRGDLETAVRQLKSQPGRGIYTAGLTLARRLAELDLIDEYELLVHPRFVGRGPTLFAGLAKPVALTLIDSRPLSSGAVALRYQPRR